MSIFDPGQAKQSAQPGDLAPADVASRLFAIRLLLSRLAQTGGGGQTLGGYVSQGPQRLPAGDISGASGDLMKALQQPGAFRRGPSVTTTKPSSPSLFQDASGGLVTLALLSKLLQDQGGISGSMGSGYDWIKNLFPNAGDSGTGMDPSVGTALANYSPPTTADPGAFTPAPTLEQSAGSSDIWASLFSNSSAA